MVYNQTNHNFYQHDTFELSRSGRPQPGSMVESEPPHLEPPHLEPNQLHSTHQPPEVSYEDTNADHYESYEADGFYQDQYYEDEHYDEGQLNEAPVHPDATKQRALPELVDQADEFVVGLMGRLTMPVVRIGLAIIFFWFGVLKLFDGVSPAQGLVEETVTALGSLFGFESVPSRQVLILLAIWEVAIGVGLLVNRYRRTFLLMLFLQLPGAILPVFLLPSLVWHTFPYGLTLEGQYIVKNLVLVGAALALGSQIRYEEQLAHQTDIDWADEDPTDQLGFEDQDDDYWAEDTLYLSPNGYLPDTAYQRQDYQAIEDQGYQTDQRFQPDTGETTGRHSFPGLLHEQPRKDDRESDSASQAFSLNPSQEDLAQEQESFDSFWVADSDQLRRPATS